MARPRDRDDWVTAAIDEIRLLLTQHHAVVKPELLARLSERYFQPDSLRFNFDPHILTIALSELVLAGDVVDVAASTRGGRVIHALRLSPGLPGSETAVGKALARKRILYARYLGWAQGTPSHRASLTGPAAERAVRTCLTEAPRIALAEAMAAETKNFLGVQLTGALDAAGYIIATEPDGLPGRPIGMLLEVKNVRQWIYPEDSEPWQLIGKALAVSTARPGYPIVPVLVCRRAHPTTRWMAKQIGFMVVEMLANFAGDVPDKAAFDEVRTELAFHDLKLGSDPNNHMRKQLSLVVPAHADKFAATWQLTMSRHDIVELLKKLSDRRLRSQTRRELVHELDRLARRHKMQGWRRNS